MLHGIMRERNCKRACEDSTFDTLILNHGKMAFPMPFILLTPVFTNLSLPTSPGLASAAACAFSIFANTVNDVRIHKPENV